MKRPVVCIKAAIHCHKRVAVTNELEPSELNNTSTQIPMPSSNATPTLLPLQANQKPALTGDRLKMFGAPDLGIS